jgi:hypothetical protein
LMYNKLRMRGYLVDVGVIEQRTMLNSKKHLLAT